MAVHRRAGYWRHLPTSGTGCQRCIHRRLRQRSSLRRRPSSISCHRFFLSHPFPLAPSIRSGLSCTKRHPFACFRCRPIFRADTIGQSSFFTASPLVSRGVLVRRHGPVTALGIRAGVVVERLRNTQPPQRYWLRFGFAGVAGFRLSSSASARFDYRIHRRARLGVDVPSATGCRSGANRAGAALPRGYNVRLARVGGVAVPVLAHQSTSLPT